MWSSLRNQWKTRCPECLAPIYLKESIELWSPITCQECHTALEVIEIEPPVLDYLLSTVDELDENTYEDEE